MGTVLLLNINLWVRVWGYESHTEVLICDNFELIVTQVD